MTDLVFAPQSGDKSDDGIKNLHLNHQIYLEGFYVNSLKVYYKNKFIGLIIITSKLTKNFEYYHQYYSYLYENEYQRILSSNNLDAAKKAFSGIL